MNNQHSNSDKNRIFLLYAFFWVISRRLNSHVGELPGRKHTTFRTWQKFESRVRLSLLFTSHIIHEYCDFKLNLLISTGWLKYRAFINHSDSNCAGDSSRLLYHNTAFITYVMVSQKIRLCWI